MLEKQVIVVAAGVILDASKSSVLLSVRHAHLDQGGLWEYPGGKVEQGESPADALSRELQEELGITPLDNQLLCSVRHDYGKKIVELHFFVVRSFSGEAKALEGQPFAWRSIDELPSIDFPEANRGVADQLNRWLSAHR